MCRKFKIYRIGERDLLNLINGRTYTQFGNVFAATIPELNGIPKGSVVRGVYYNAQVQCWDLVLFNEDFEETIEGSELPVVCINKGGVTNGIFLLLELTKEEAKTRYTQAWNTFRSTYDEEERSRLMVLMDSLQPYICYNYGPEWEEFAITLEGFKEYWDNMLKFRTDDI